MTWRYFVIQQLQMIKVTFEDWPGLVAQWGPQSDEGASFTAVKATCNITSTESKGWSSSEQRPGCEGVLFFSEKLRSKTKTLITRGEKTFLKGPMNMKKWYQTPRKQTGVYNQYYPSCFRDTYCLFITQMIFLSLTVHLISIFGFTWHLIF